MHRHSYSPADFDAGLTRVVREQRWFDDASLDAWNWKNAKEAEGVEISTDEYFEKLDEFLRGNYG